MCKNRTKDGFFISAMAFIKNGIPGDKMLIR